MKNNREAFYDVPEYDTIKEIIINGVKKGGDKKQFIYLDKNETEHTTSFNMTWRDVCGLGCYTYKVGLAGKKKIAIFAENSYEWIVAYYATLVGGNTSVPLDLKLNIEDLAEQLINCECDAIFYTHKLEKKLGEIKAYPGMHEMTCICIDNFPQYYKEGLEIFDSGERAWLDAEVTKDDLACIVYTSGTTGKSKGVMLSHYNLASDAIASYKVMKGRHAIGFLPLNHTYAWVSALFAGYILSEYGYICNGIKNIQKDLQTYQPYNFAGVPLVVETIYERVWKTAAKTGREEILKKGLKISRFLMKLGIDKRRKIFKQILDNLGGNLNMIVCGGANLNPKHEQGLYDFGILVINGYGITECSPAVTCNRVNNFRFGSVGLPLPCNEIKINEPDESGVGEIYVRGSNVMVGYYNDPEATAEAFDGDWFKTGDYGRIDEDGFLYFIGRKKNLIVTKGGKNVSPEELEDKLLRIDYITEVLVYQENEAITAEFYLNETEYPDARARLKADLTDFNHSQPIFKRITKTKIRDEEFPKTTTLKIIRNYDK